ncbi:hypothetical protein [Maricaulis sp.]|uniref:hypothetical protein n=1 Tax=Maricaulis sp. TaxID=1486257 RepID=UPI001B145B4E|nr:hypothetical protein [Maricaulis sp.]MBO6763603.1 hypothetical protein [Maricaulis sp.]
MRATTAFSTLFKGLVVLRVSYAVLLFSGTMAFRLSGDGPFDIDEHVAAMLRSFPLWYFLVWGGFVGGYALAALMLLLRSWLALPVYAIAFTVDFLLSLYWFQQPGMDRAYSGSANLVEWGLNAFDLTVIAVLVLAGSVFTRDPD